MTLRDYPAALRYLSRFTDYERAQRVLYGHSPFRLRRLARILLRLGRPERAIPVVHVTGSKGKGTTATLIAELARAHGLRVGLYTSPHLQDMRERIRVDGEPIPRAQFVAGLARVLDAALVHPEDRERVERGACDGPLPDRFPTYFELMTALAFEHFRARGCDLAVVEVGLGGRLDATNLVRAPVAVITRIELEHVDVLGDTLEAIAGEKAGIIKRGVRFVVTGETQPGPQAVITGAARRRDAELLRLGVELTARRVDAKRRGPGPRLCASFDTPGLALPGAGLALLGRHNVDNALLALGALFALERLGVLRRDPDAIRAALARVQVPGRTQVCERTWRGRVRPVLIDSCHTGDSALALRRTVEESWPRARRGLVFGALRGKNIAAMLDVLAPAFGTVLLVPVASPRSWDPAEVAGPAHFVARDLCHALAGAFVCAREWDVLAVAGSMYLAGEALDTLGFAKRSRGRPRT